MKVYVSLFASLMLAAAPALAQEVTPIERQYEEFAPVFELEDGPISFEDLQAIQYGEMELFAKKGPKAPGKGGNGGGNGGHNNNNDAGREIIGAIIGGIVGAIGAHIIEDQYHHYKPNRQVTCFARNRRGEVFRAQGPRNRARAVQSRAMDKCYRFSHRCQPAGCRF